MQKNDFYDIKTMSLYLRPAAKSDCKLLFDWRNEPSTRQNSFNQNEITYEEHIAWFEKMMSDENRKQYILMNDTTPVGQVRVYIDDKEAEISYSIGEAFQGKGFGTKIVELLEKQIKIDFPHIKTLVANVKTENLASRRIFEKNLFRESYVVYTKEIIVQNNRWWGGGYKLTPFIRHSYLKTTARAAAGGSHER